jgi:hypothetical protein
MAAASQTWPSYKFVSDGIEFTAGVDDESRVRFVATTDSSFAPPEGVRVGDVAAAAVAAAPGEQIITEVGWGHYLTLPSGWAVLLDDSYTDTSKRIHLNLGTRPLSKDAKIAMLFMRDWQRARKYRAA